MDPGYGYRGWGGYGWGYGRRYYWPWWLLGYGYGGYAGYGPGYYNAAYYAPTTTQAAQAAPPAADQYIAAGEQAFKSGQYESAIRSWQHALVEDPANGGVAMMMAQALFAIGQYDAAASAVQVGMQSLEQAQWGNLVKNYRELYPNIQNYSTQLKALEKARDTKPDDPALRFLLGYHFGYLGYPKEAVRELDKCLDRQPQDQAAWKLRAIFAPQAGLPDRPRTPTS